MGGKSTFGGLQERLGVLELKTHKNISRNRMAERLHETILWKAVGLVEKLKQYLKKMVLWAYSVFARLLPVDPEKIVFQSSLGRNAAGSPRAVYEKIVELGLDRKRKCYYILDEPEKYRGKLPGRVRLLKNARLRYYFVMASAGVWVSDTRFQNYIIKRKGVCYIQTWHGTPLKKLACDMESLHMAGGESLKEYKQEFVKNAATWDYLVSQNPFSTQVFRRAFGYSGAMLEIGYPRNDRLFLPFTGTQEEEKTKLGLPAGKRVMLYAPTWRDDAFYNKSDYRFDSKMDFKAMRQAFGEEYILVVKYHYMVRDREDWGRFAGFVYPVGDEVDIAALYRISDLLITDYSSVMFDYSILHRPMYFYAYDLEAYRDNLRGFYFDMEREVPGPVVTTTEELTAAIREEQPVLTGTPDDDYQAVPAKYRERYRRFCETYNPFDNGKAAEKIAEMIREQRETKRQNRRHIWKRNYRL